MLTQTAIVSPMARKAKGKKDRHFNPVLGIRLPSDLMDAFRRLANDNRRTLTAEVMIALESHLKAQNYWPPNPEED